MKSSMVRWTALLMAVTVIVIGCKQSMVISRVDYSQSIESVLTPNEQGVVKDVQHGLTFNIKPLQYVETRDTSTVTTNEVRYIRGTEGFYYITAPNYKNVYVMAPEKGKLKLKKKLVITEKGLEEPAFNQREQYIQLLNQKTGESWRVNPESIKKMESKMANREGK